MPDYGEPWEPEDGVSDIVNRHGNHACDWCSFSDDTLRDRAISCVNACAGIDDPESRIGKLFEHEMNLEQLAAAVIELDPSSKYLELSVKRVQKLARELVAALAPKGETA